MCESNHDNVKISNGVLTYLICHFLINGSGCKWQCWVVIGYHVLINKPVQYMPLLTSLLRGNNLKLAL